MKATQSSGNLLFSVSPSPSVHQFVVHLKKHIREVLGHNYDGLHAPTCISLCLHQGNQSERFLYDADLLMKNVRPFHVNFKNFNVVRTHDKRTIYLEVVNRWPLCELSEKLSGNPDFFPHITIASNLNSSDFHKVWNSLRDYEYSNYFRCDRITVMKKDVRRWVTYVELPFAA